MLSNPSLMAIAVVFTVLTSASALAQDTRAVPADVETIVTGGQWKSDKLSGTYRVKVRTGGFEHIVSQVQIDWIAQFDDRNEPRVVNSKLVETAAWRLLQPRIIKTSGNWRAARGTWKIDVGRPGALVATLRQR